MKRSTICLRLMLGAALLSLLACQKIKPEIENPTPSDQQRQAARAAEVPESTQRKWTHLNRIRQKDAFNTSIDRTLLDDQGQLGIVLYISVAPEKVPALVRDVMTEMAREFPQEDVTLGVYRSASPPQRLGTAHLDGKTGESTYTAL